MTPSAIRKDIGFKFDTRPIDISGHLLFNYTMSTVKASRGKTDEQSFISVYISKEEEVTVL